MLFATPDYLAITVQNQNESLIQNRPCPMSSMRVLREGKSLIAEYFAYQFCAAIELPGPKISHIKIESGTDVKTYIDSEEVRDFISFNDSCLDKNTQTATVKGKRYRLDPSLFISFIAELVIQDNDQCPCQYLIARHQDRLYRMSIDKELARAKSIANNESEFWITVAKICQKYFSPYESTLEQQFAIVHRLQMICSGEPSILYQIFYNSRVQASSELISNGFRDALYDAWLKNAQQLINAYKSRYQSQFENYGLREKVRQHFAKKVCSLVKLPLNIELQLFEDQLVNDLCSRLYFDNPSNIDESLLNNHWLIKRVAYAEELRLFESSNNLKTNPKIIASVYTARKSHFKPQLCRLWKMNDKTIVSILTAEVTEPSYQFCRLISIESSTKLRVK